VTCKDEFAKPSPERDVFSYSMKALRNVDWASSSLKGVHDRTQLVLNMPATSVADNMLNEPFEMPFKLEVVVIFCLPCVLKLYVCLFNWAVLYCTICKQNTLCCLPLKIVHFV